MNRKVKKLFLVVASLICLCIALTACGQKKEEGNNNASAPAAVPESTPAVVPETSPAPVPETSPAPEAKDEKDTVVKEEKVTEEIPFDVQEAYSEEMATGESAVTQIGQNGQKEVTYKVTYKDGKEVNREAVNETVVTDPIAQVITYGTGQGGQEVQPQQPGGDGERYEVNRVKVPGCADGSYGYYEIYYSDGTVEYEEYQE